MARPARATAAPVTTSKVQWFAVATTANAIATGMTMAATRAVCLRSRTQPSLYQTTPTSRFQPKWRLGTAANLLTRAGGWSTR